MDLQFEKDGVTFRARTEYDEDHGTPWENEDGHGPVSDWTRRKKLPGELVLAEDRGSYRYYDYAEACRIARRDGWGHMPYKLTVRPDNEDRPAYTACGGWAEAGPYRAYDPTNFNAAVAAVYAQHRATMTARQYAAAAALADFDRLRRWCNDDWCYVGVIVESLDDEGDVLDSSSLWGIESDADDYLDEVAQDLATELLAA